MKLETLERHIAFGHLPDKYIQVPCGKCYHCLKKKVNQWRVRLTDEFHYSDNKNSYFITLTLNPETYDLLEQGEVTYYTLIRRFSERYRKKYKKSIRYWTIDELGDRTQRWHIHGFIFNSLASEKTLKDLWKPYGFSVFKKITLKRINYCLKYLLKPEYLANFDSSIKCSRGIGKQRIVKLNQIIQNYEQLPRPIHYEGRAHPLPRYYYTKLYDEYQRYKHGLLHAAADYPLVIQKIQYPNKTLKQKLYANIKQQEYYEETIRRGTSKPNPTKPYSSTKIDLGNRHDLRNAFFKEAETISKETP